MLIVPYLLPLGTNYWMRGQTVIDQFYFVHHPTAVYNTWMLKVSFSDACFSCIVLCWSLIFSSLKVNNLNGKLDKNIFVKFFPKLLIHVIGLKTIQNLSIFVNTALLNTKLTILEINTTTWSSLEWTVYCVSKWFLRQRGSDNQINLRSFG